jgi:hypothetical protein
MLKQKAGLSSSDNSAFLLPAGRQCTASRKNLYSIEKA